MANLTIVLVGPKTTDVRIYSDGYRVGGLQTVDFRIDAEHMIPSINVSFPLIRLRKEDIPQGDGYVTLTYEDAITDGSKMLAEKVITVKYVSQEYGEIYLGGISRITFWADVTEETHTLTLVYGSKDLFESAIEAEEIDRMPNWVNFVVEE